MQSSSRLALAAFVLIACAPEGVATSDDAGGTDDDEGTDSGYLAHDATTGVDSSAPAIASSSSGGGSSSGGAIGAGHDAGFDSGSGSGGDSGGSGSDSGSEGALPACGPTVAAGTSDSCVPLVGECADKTCSLPSYGYSCTPTSVPPLSGCVAYPLSASGISGAYCCPDLTCLRNSSIDVTCSTAGQGEAYTCGMQGSTLMYTTSGLPSGCAGQGGGNWCCP